MYRKNHLAQVTAFCLSMGLVLGNGVTALADDETVGFAQCNEYLNVRTDPDGTSQVIGLLRNNGRVTILGEENGWLHIQSGNVEGYVSSEYVATGEEAEQISKTAGYTTAEVGAEVLNIRADADEASEAVGTAYENQELEVVEDDGDWVKVVTDDGVYGYVSVNYVYTSTAYRLAETIDEYEERTAVPTVNNGGSTAADSSSDSSGQEETAYTEETSAEETQVYTEEPSYTGETQNYTEEPSYTEETQAYTEEPAYTEETQAYTEETQVYTEETQAYTEETQGYTEETQAYTEETQGYTEETQAYTEETQAYTEETQGYTEETQAYTEETQGYTESSSTGSATGQAVADYACQFIGGPYVYGGTSLTNGCDCSGFVMAVYANFGISLPHYSGSQMGYGTAVDASSLAPGDLVFYGAGGSDHVAIYIGGGSVVHAAGEQYGIITSSISWAGTPTGYRRLV